MEIKNTTNLQSQIYKDALKIRTSVFVDEQKVPEALEIDADEANCRYFVGYLNGTAVATARILPTETEAHIQRVAVAAAFRHQQLGSEIMQAIITWTQKHDFTALTLNAQETAVAFYQQLNFKLVPGEHFLDAGIWHRAMRLEFPVK